MGFAASFKSKSDRSIPHYSAAIGNLQPFLQECIWKPPWVRQAGAELRSVTGVAVSWVPWQALTNALLSPSGIKGSQTWNTNLSGSIKAQNRYGTAHYNLRGDRARRALLTHFIAPEGKQSCASPSVVQWVGGSEPALLGAQAQGNGFTGTLQDGPSRNKGQEEAATMKSLATVVWQHWVGEEKDQPTVFFGNYPPSSARSWSSFPLQDLNCSKQGPGFWHEDHRPDSEYNFFDICNTLLSKLRSHWRPLNLLSSSWDAIRFLAQYSSIWVTWRE